MFIFDLSVSTTVFAQRQDTGGAITGTNPVAGQTTGIGQVISPIINSSISNAPPRRDIETTVPYPQAPSGIQSERVNGSYYGEDVRTKGQYYQEDVRTKGKYEEPQLPAEEVKTPEAPEAHETIQRVPARYIAPIPVKTPEAPKTIERTPARYHAPRRR
ncbi:MAG: hypothetical protein V2A66_01440 [Pseudomonadota bacterium]